MRMIILSALFAVGVGFAGTTGAIGSASRSRRCARGCELELACCRTCQYYRRV